VPKSSSVSVESLFKQMMDMHVQIAPESYVLTRNYKKYIKEKLESSKFYKYVISDKLVGVAFYYIHVKRKQKIMVITDLVIDEVKRGNGHGAKLLTKLHNIARDKNCDQIQLIVAYKNIPAKTLYESFGYKPSKIHMYKELKNV
jgi:ribosomal protein S18 acetylase RimI-like enzyme